MRAVPMSRRALERGFLRKIGRTIHDEIIRTRLDRARDLLNRTDMSLPEIATRCGFSSSSRLGVAFKRETDVSPGKFRAARTRDRSK